MITPMVNGAWLRDGESIQTTRGASPQDLHWFDRTNGFGDGVFETMLVRNRQVELRDYHMERLQQGLTRLGIPPVSYTHLTLPTIG